VPSDRLLVLTGVGIMPPLAAWIMDAVSGERSRLRLACAGLLVLMHLLVDPLALPFSALTPYQFEKLASEFDRSLPDDPRLGGQSLFVLEVPDSILMSYLPAIRWFEHKPRPERAYWLLSQVVSAQLERREPNLLRISAADGFFDPDRDLRRAHSKTAASLQDAAVGRFNRAVGADHQQVLVAPIKLMTPLSSAWAGYDMVKL
jgi:hypothetical protein